MLSYKIKFFDRFINTKLDLVPVFSKCFLFTSRNKTLFFCSANPSGPFRNNKIYSPSNQTKNHNFLSCNSLWLIAKPYMLLRVYQVEQVLFVIIDLKVLNYCSRIIVLD